MKISVLVTTMNQIDTQKYDLMNLNTDAVIANQTNFNAIKEEKQNGHKIVLVSTDTRGVSRNRNIALAHYDQSTDVVVFADDDLVFNDGYERMIAEEFSAHPDAEAIKFNLHDLSKTRKISMKRIEHYEKATRRNMSSSGVWGVAIKTSSLMKYNLKFDERFGPGTSHANGEDTIFLMNMIDKGVSFYRSPMDIAGIDQTDSSWFHGYNKEFFTNNGMIIDVIYPAISRILAIRSAYKFSKRDGCDMSFCSVLKCYNDGIRANRKCD